MAVVPDPDSDDQDAAEQLAQDGVRPLLEARRLDVDGTRSLLSSARHELGSPLQSIQGFSELLKSEAFGALSQEQQGFLEHILVASGELRSAMDACLELAELELVGRAPCTRLVELQAALIDALEQAQRRTGVVTRVQPSARRVRLSLDSDLFRRAFETLLIALSTRDDPNLVVAFEAHAEYALVSVARTARHARTATLPLPALAARATITRNLLWLRLAHALFNVQDASLSLNETLDYAEVRLRVGAAH